MVALETSLLSFWIMVNDSWMQVPTGFCATLVRFPRMMLAAYVASAFCVARTGAWYMLGGDPVQEELTMALRLAAILVPMQIFFEYLTGNVVHDHQPAKFAAIEGRWHNEQPASEVLIARPARKLKAIATRSPFRIWTVWSGP